MGGAITYVYRNGARLTPWMLYVITLIDAELFRLFGVHVIVSSGIRTYGEQVSIFLSRYVRAADVRGRRVYDTRVWNGVRWYRISSAGTVAVPSTSNHEIQGDRAAVDLRDTGNDAGIATMGSRRSNWLRANAHRFGLVASGFSFGEAWHYDVLGIFRTPPAPKPPAPKPPVPKPEPEPEPEPEPKREDIMAFKSIAVGYRPDPNVDRIIATALDWEDGTKSDAIVKKDYGINFYGALTEGGFLIITEGHYNDVLAEFDAAVKAKREHELAVARASAGAS